MGATISGMKALTIRGPAVFPAGFRGFLGFVLIVGLVLSVFGASIGAKTSSRDGQGTALSELSVGTPHELDTCDDSSACSPYFLLIATGKSGLGVPNELQAIAREHASLRFLSPKVDMPPPRKRA